MTEGNGQREPATPQEIWEILREVSAVAGDARSSMRETGRRMLKTDRRIRASVQTDQLLAQARAADRRMDKLDELFNGQWGKLMEALVEGAASSSSSNGASRWHTVTNPRQNYGERRWEFDIAAINGEEVWCWKSRPPSGCPTSIISYRLNEQFPELMPEFAERRSYGAVALSEGIPGVGRA